MGPSLAEPLRRALDVVLLRADPPDGGVEALAVDVAVLEVLQALADRARLLLVLDDLQWLDAPTRQVLEFAVRRVEPSRIGVLAASRELAPDIFALVPEPLELVEIGPVTKPELADIVAERTGRVPSPHRAAELHRLSGGNPFLALELARGDGRHGGQHWDAQQFSVPERYGRLLSDRLSVLSTAGRRAVLAAALLSRPTTAVLAEVAGRSGVPEAEEAGILHVGGAAGEAVEFDHPLLAAACRETAGPRAVREMHLVLGSLAADPVERAHHLALGRIEADAALADEVESAADVAAQRTAIATAAGLAREALRLTPSVALEDRVRRVVLSSDWFAQCGELAEAEAVVTPVLDGLPAGSLRARCLVARANALGQEVAGGLVLMREAIQQPGIDPETETSARMFVAAGLLNTGDFESARAEAGVTAAVATAAGVTELVFAARLLEAQADLFLGVPLEESVAWAEAQGGTEVSDISEHPDMTLAFATAWRDDPDEAARLVDRLLRMARERGDLRSEGGLLMHRAEIALRVGDLETARICADRCYRILADGVRDQVSLYIRAHVEAWRGELDEARRLATTGLAMADEAADAIFAAQCLLVLGFTEVSAGRFEEAACHEARLSDLMASMKWGHPGALRWQGDAVEAFLATGAVDDAAEVTARLWEEADRMGLAGSRAVAARCEGLLHSHRGDLKLAEDSMLESLALMTGLDMPLERARTLLALGATRRRGRQKASARASLAEARDLFSRAGA
ncbi:MAG TPA: hypothetical protein VFG97_07750, partial [Pedococcus sp.]|nr:hypothetical protein [Pedococcus sp.]